MYIKYIIEFYFYQNLSPRFNIYILDCDKIFYFNSLIFLFSKSIFNSIVSKSLNLDNPYIISLKYIQFYSFLFSYEKLLCDSSKVGYSKFVSYNSPSPKYLIHFILISFLTDIILVISNFLIIISYFLNL